MDGHQLRFEVSKAKMSLSAAPSHGLLYRRRPDPPIHTQVLHHLLTKKTSNQTMFF